MTPGEIASAVSAERGRQRQKWNGPHAHGHGDCSSPYVTPWVKFAVLGEEVGEVGRALLEGNLDQLRAELIQVNAVTHAWLEAL